MKRKGIDPKRVFRRRSAPLAAAALLALSAFAAGCGDDGDGGGASDEGPIKVGALLPLTGPAAFFGPLQRDGLTLRLSEAGGEAAGRPVELKVLDSGATLESAQTAARRLVEQEDVAMIVGPLQSDLMAGMAPYYEQVDVPAIALLNLPRQLGGKVFTPQGALPSVSAPMGVYAAKEGGVETATVEVSDYIAGQDVADGFTEGFTENGGKVVQTQAAPLTASDFAPYLSNLKPADALVVWNVGTTQIFLEEYLKRGAYDNTLIGYGDAITEEQLAAFGSDSLGWQTPLTYTWRLDTPASEEFAKAVQAKYDRNPVAQIDEGSYEAMSVALEALEATDGDTDPGALRDAILALDLDTPAGPVSFNGDGFGVRNVYILEVSKFGNELGWKPIKTYEDVGAEG
jgi:branched-chain amino acid transport system substrate-binding protein